MPSKKKFIDANIILRYLVGDLEAEQIEKFFQKQKEFYVADIILAEVIWILLSFYKWKKDKFIPKIKTFLTPSFIKADKRLIENALTIYAENNIDYIDAYLVALMKKNKSKDLYSFDRDFDKIPGIRRIEPK